jgi:branched-chain amino acid transport system ATP-binding protein
MALTGPIGLAFGCRGARCMFSAMTVRENLLIGAYTRADRAMVNHDYERVLEPFPRLRERLAQRAGTLSGGEQQMLVMARALMCRPRLICGVTIFMVEQSTNLALQIADYGYVLQTGRIALAEPARALLHNPQIRDAYLGAR